MSSKRSSSSDEDSIAWPVWRVTKQRAVAGDFSDLVVECGDEKHNVHKLVMAASHFFAKACSGPFIEAKEGIIKLPDDNPEAVEAMIEYLYHGCYGWGLKGDYPGPPAPCPINCACQAPNEPSNPIHIVSDSGSDDNSSAGTSSDGSDGGSEDDGNVNNQTAHPQNAPAAIRTANLASPIQDCDRHSQAYTSAAMACFELPLDALVYALGEKYDLPGMKKLALDTFRETVRETPRHVISGPFREAAIIAYSSTPDDDRNLRRCIVAAITKFEYSSDSPEIKTLLEEIPNLRVDVSAGLFDLAASLRYKVRMLENNKKDMEAQRAREHIQEPSRKRKW